MIVKLGEYPDCHCDGEEDVCKGREVVVQIDPWDTWSLDTTLSKIIAPALIQLRDTTHGFPCDFEKFEDWVEVLNKMIFAHEAIASETWEDQFYTGEVDVSFVPVSDDEDAGSTVVTGPNHTLKFDADGYDAFDARINEGLELFGKYYRGLWD